MDLSHIVWLRDRLKSTWPFLNLLTIGPTDHQSNSPQDRWSVGLMGRKTNGPRRTISPTVGPMVCRTSGGPLVNDKWLVRLMVGLLVRSSSTDYQSNDLKHHQSYGPQVLRTIGLMVMVLRTTSFTFLRTINPTVHWSYGQLVQWSYGPLVLWAIDPTGHWTNGPSDHWTTDHWSCGKQSNDSQDR